MSLVDSYLRQGAARQRLAVGERRVRGVVSWNMGDACNYRCSYCTQRRLGDRSARLTDARASLEAFATLPGVWEFKLSGGEPFQQPGLLRVVRGLVQRGHVISIQTNFSAPDALLGEFLEATRGSLHTFSASLHLERATAARFVERYRRWIQPLEAAGVRFHVTSVATTQRLEQLRDEVAPALLARGITFKVQPLKQGGYPHPYDRAQRKILLQLGGHCLTGGIEHDFQGRICHAGSRYLVVKSSGQAYRCYPASRVGGRHARLGSLAGGLKLLSEPKICPYTYCNCTVPISRGMIVGWQPPEAIKVEES